MLDLFFGYISERSFLMAEFPMNNCRNNFDHVKDAEISTHNFDEVPFPRDDVIDEGCIENEDRPNANPIDFDQVNPVYTVDDADYSGNDPDIQHCSISFVSSSSSVEVN